MYLYYIFILSIFILITKANKLEPYHSPYCPLDLPPITRPTTLLDLDIHSDQELKTCLIKNIYIHQPLLLIGGHNTKSNALLQKYKTYEDPHIKIMTKQLTRGILNSSSIRRVFRSHRSVVHIIVTDEKKYSCKDGSINQTELLGLEMFMKSIWRKYRIARVFVTFPLACEKKIVIYGDKIDANVLYDRSIKLIEADEFHKGLIQSGLLLTEGYPLRANVFKRFPTSINKCDTLHYYTRINLNLTEGFCGLDALVMHEIVKHFKFNLMFPKNSNCYKYGYVNTHNITGSLGCVVRKELDISFNSRFMTMYSEDHIYFLHYVTTDSLCVMVKRTDKIPLWLYPITVYDTALWFLIFLLIVVIGMIMWAVGKVKNSMVNNMREPLYYYLKDAFTSVMCGFSFMVKGKLYVLRGTCLCSSIMFLAIYQGHVNHIFTTLLRYGTIQTLNSLYQSDYNLYVSPSMREILRQQEDPDNELQRNFLKRSRDVPDGYVLDYVNQNPHAALLGRKQDSVLEILNDHMDKYARPVIYVIDECFYTYYLSYIARTGFPFYEELQRFMQRVGEAGLPIIYYKWTCNMLRVPQSLPPIRNEPRTFQKIELGDQRLAFYILFTGQILSFLIFIIELLKGRR